MRLIFSIGARIGLRPLKHLTRRLQISRLAISAIERLATIFTARRARSACALAYH